MSETDSFINEVSDEVRKDKLYKQFKKYGWILVLVVVAIVGGTAYNEWSKSTQKAEAERVGDLLSAAVKANDPQALATLANDGAANALIAQLAQANLLIEAGDAPSALDALRRVANNLEATPVYTDLAWLKLLMLDGENMSASERNSAYDRLSAANGPYRLLALEQRAMQYIRDGDLNAAKSELTAILADPAITPGLRSRAQQLIVALGGDIEAESANG